MTHIEAAARAEEKRARVLVTPEGAPLKIRIGEAGERAGAFLFDLLVMAGIGIALVLAGLSLFGASGGAGGEIMLSFFLLGFFALRCFYFTAFEMGPAAATPGKRLLKLRVAARDGGRLTAEAIFARNAMRELEVFLPLTFLAANARDSDAFTMLAGAVWTSVFVFFPLFNRDRLRAGDLIAGTWVIKAPKPVLLADLTEARAPGAAQFAFTQAQLDVYGEHELGVLETVLRRADPPTLEAVAERIRGKIGWVRTPAESDFDFLNGYYRALRGRLETGLLFGKRRLSKYDPPR